MIDSKDLEKLIDSKDLEKLEKIEKLKEEMELAVKIALEVINEVKKEKTEMTEPLCNVFLLLLFQEIWRELKVILTPPSPVFFSTFSEPNPKPKICIKCKKKLTSDDYSFILAPDKYLCEKCRKELIDELEKK